MTNKQQCEDNPGVQVVIHYCALCQWQLRASWMGQEILQTFSPSEVSQVSLRPGEGGVFRIWCDIPNGDSTEFETQVVWDRRIDNGFPDSKELKRRLRNIICPNKSLGHYDTVS